MEDRTGGYGIVRTTDHGATWEPVFATPPWSQLAVMDLAISPGFDADTFAFATTKTGLLRTGDRGTTWERLHGGLPEPGNDPTADNIVRVSLTPGLTLDRTLLTLQSSGALFLSPDRGNAWSRPPVAPLAAAAFSRNFQTDGTLFAVTTDGGLSRSTDRGATWTVLQQLAVRPVADIGYAIEPVSPNIPGPVYRLLLAGDHIYAAAGQGLLITLSEGRRWDRHSNTPVAPVRSAAPCPD